MTDVNIITADDVTLEAELSLPEQPRAGVVVTHPNPLMGGDMYTPVPAAMFGALGELGVAGLRFNFRGVGRSSGTHDKGRGEQLDVAAAIEHLAGAAPGVPILLAGWSFGADVALAVDDERVAGWFLAAPPLRVVDPEDMAARLSAAPKVLAVPERDQFAPPDVVRPIVASWQNATVEVIEGADHFFGMHMAQLTAIHRVRPAHGPGGVIVVRRSPARSCGAQAR